MAKMQSYAPKAKTVSIPRPAGSTEGSTKSSNAPTVTQAHAAAKGKTFVSGPSETHGVRGGLAVSGKSKGDGRKGL